MISKGFSGTSDVVWQLLKYLWTRETIPLKFRVKTKFILRVLVCQTDGGPVQNQSRQTDFDRMIINNQRNPGDSSKVAVFEMHALLSVLCCSCRESVRILKASKISRQSVNSDHRSSDRLVALSTVFRKTTYEYMIRIKIYYFKNLIWPIIYHDGACIMSPLAWVSTGDTAPNRMTIFDSWWFESNFLIAFRNEKLSYCLSPGTLRHESASRKGLPYSRWCWWKSLNDRRLLACSSNLQKALQNGISDFWSKVNFKFCRRTKSRTAVYDLQRSAWKLWFSSGSNFSSRTARIQKHREMHTFELLKRPLWN